MVEKWAASLIKQSVGWDNLELYQEKGKINGKWLGFYTQWFGTFQNKEKFFIIIRASCAWVNQVKPDAKPQFKHLPEDPHQESPNIL